MFLAEAFTRPAVMSTLAKLGFSQSYTYFTWRNSRRELEEYITELAGKADWFRPNFFVNTPDIFHEYLQQGGRPAFEARTVLAATLSPSWGMYSGFERAEGVPRPPRERGVPRLREVRVRRGPRSAAPLGPLVRRCNEIRRASDVFRQVDNVTFVDTANDALLAYVKGRGPGAVIMCVNLDPRDCTPRASPIVPTGLDLPDAFAVVDLLSGDTHTWHVGGNYLRLPPGRRPRPGVPMTTGELIMPRHELGDLRRQLAPSESATDAPRWFESDPMWFKRAVFYEIHIRGFADGNGDGIGDFLGLTERLDYLEWLGIDCIWLLPFYASPLRDGGYDISDYYSVHPDYGTTEHFAAFVEAAHQRGIRVIADLVMNHTSSDHAWFQEARASPDSPKRDWYVWSDTEDRYKDARIIFVDTETSNWTWDPVAGQYYWHRFFSHQPDLNYDNPEVQEALLDVMRYWLDFGLDGLRLDAVPYLFEREGTDCENLPETHEFLQARCAARSTPSTPTACCWRRRTSGRPTSSSTSATATSATWRSSSR